MIREVAKVKDLIEELHSILIDMKLKNCGAIELVLIVYLISAIVLSIIKLLTP